MLALFNLSKLQVVKVNRGTPIKIILKNAIYKLHAEVIKLPRKINNCDSVYSGYFKLAYPTRHSAQSSTHTDRRRARHHPYRLQVRKIPFFYQQSIVAPTAISPTGNFHACGEKRTPGESS